MGRTSIPLISLIIVIGGLCVIALFTFSLQMKEYIDFSATKDRHESELQNLRETIEKENEQKEALYADIKQLNLQKESLKQIVDTKETIVSRVSELTTECNLLSKVHSSQKEENARLDIEIARKSETVVQTDKLIENQKRELDALNVKLSETTQKFAEYTQRNTALDEEFRLKITAQDEAFKKELNEKRTELRELNAEIKLLQEAKNTASEQASIAEVEARTLRENTTKLRAIFSETEDQNSALKAQSQELQTQVKILNKQVEVCRAEVSQLSTEKDVLAAQILKNRQDVQTEKSKLEVIKSEKEALDVELDEEHQNLVKIKTLKSEEEARIGILEEERKVLEREIAQKKKELEVLVREIKQKRNEKI